MSRRFFVITGATGAGKTDIINELKKRGYHCVEEVARHIIQEQTRIDGDAVPWKNLQRFKKMMLDQFIKTYAQAMKHAEEITFFDRDVLDLIAYDRLTGQEPSLELQKAVKTLVYNNKVFVLPPWKEIYLNDAERKQTYEETVKIYDNLVKVYKEYGRELIEVPKMSVEKRADFIIKASNEIAPSAFQDNELL